MDFTNAAFGRDVSFENRQFLKSASFEGCIFTKAPVFHGCALHEGTTFPSREKFKDVTSTHAAKAYRTLKLAMEQVRARREEGMFYALEQYSRRCQPDTPPSEKLVSHLYGWTADYGEKFLRPLGWLAGTTLVSFSIYTGIVYFPTGALSHLRECFEFTIEQLVRPFSVWLPSGGTVLKEPFGANPDLMLILQFFATLQTLVSLSLITLFILALRRRFKLG